MGGVSVEQGVDKALVTANGGGGMLAYYFESFNDLISFNILKWLKWLCHVHFTTI